MAAFNAYSTRPAHIPEERDGVLGIWEGSLGDRPNMERKFRWFYQDAPTGIPLTMLLEWRAAEAAEPELIGVATAGRRRFVLAGRAVEAGVLVDMAVRTGHRTLGPALQLQKSLLAAGLQSASFLYGFPNPKAAAVFQRAGYTRLGTIQRHVHVLRASGYLERLLPRSVARWLAPPADLALRVIIACRALAHSARPLQWLAPGDAPEMLSGNSPGLAPLLRGARGRDFLAWRFASDRADRYSLVMAPDPSGQLYWVVENKGKVLQINDCAPALLARTYREYWRALFRDAQRRGYHSISFECLAPTTLRTELTLLGMSMRSERPVFWATTPEQAGQFQGAEWYLTSADEDE